MAGDKDAADAAPAGAAAALAAAAAAGALLLAGLIARPPTTGLAAEPACAAALFGSHTAAARRGVGAGGRCRRAPLRAAAAGARVAQLSQRAVLRARQNLPHALRAGSWGGPWRMHQARRTHKAYAWPAHRGAVCRAHGWVLASEQPAQHSLSAPRENSAHQECQTAGRRHRTCRTRWLRPLAAQLCRKPECTMGQVPSRAWPRLGGNGERQICGGARTGRAARVKRASCAALRWDLAGAWAHAMMWMCMAFMSSNAMYLCGPCCSMHACARATAAAAPACTPGSSDFKIAHASLHRARGANLDVRLDVGQRLHRGRARAAQAAYNCQQASGSACTLQMQLRRSTG